MLLLWLQFPQRDLIIIIDLKFITVTVFKINMKTLSTSKLGTQSWQVSHDILTFAKICLVTDLSILASMETA